MPRGILWPRPEYTLGYIQDWGYTSARYTGYTSNSNLKNLKEMSNELNKLHLCTNKFFCGRLACLYIYVTCREIFTEYIIKERKLVLTFKFQAYFLRTILARPIYVLKALKLAV